MAKNKSGRRVPNLLRKYRKVRGYKQKDVARILDLKSPSRISRWENGVCLPSFENVLRLAVVYRVMVDVIYPDLLANLKEDIMARESKVISPKSPIRQNG